MENKKRYHNATNIAGTDRLELSTTQPYFVMLSSNWNPNVKNGDGHLQVKIGNLSAMPIESLC